MIIEKFSKASPRKGESRWVARSSVDRSLHPLNCSKAWPICWGQIQLQVLPERKNISCLPITSPCLSGLPCIAEETSRPSKD